MPDFPRPDLIGIDVKVSCNAVPGCTPDTPCAGCREILTGERDEDPGTGLCHICEDEAGGTCVICDRPVCDDDARMKDHDRYCASCAPGPRTSTWWRP